MTSPLPEALARLRSEVAAAEEHLAKITAEGASFGAQIAAAASVTVARQALTATARGHRADAQLVRDAVACDAGAQALADALASLDDEDQAHDADDPNPDDEHPLAGLFR